MQCIWVNRNIFHCIVQLGAHCTVQPGAGQAVVVWSALRCYYVHWLSVINFTACFCYIWYIEINHESFSKLQCSILTVGITREKKVGGSPMWRSVLVATIVLLAASCLFVILFWLLLSSQEGSLGMWDVGSTHWVLSDMWNLLRFYSWSIVALQAPCGAS